MPNKPRKPRVVERCFFTYEQLLKRKKWNLFLLRVVTGDKECLCYDNRKRQKSWEYPGNVFRRRLLSSCTVFG